MEIQNRNYYEREGKTIVVARGYMGPYGAEDENPRVVVLTPSMMEDMTPEERAKRKEEFLKKWEHRRLKV